jgi:hypothetical protein
MTAARIIGMAAVVAALSLGITSLGSELFYMHWLRSLIADGRRSLSETSAEGLEHDIRTGLPAGSSPIAVETVLRNRHIDYHLATVHEIDASAPDVKGGTLSLTFHFDDHDALTSIDSHAASDRP